MIRRRTAKPKIRCCRGAEAKPERQGHRLDAVTGQLKGDSIIRPELIPSPAQSVSARRFACLRLAAEDRHSATKQDGAGMQDFPTERLERHWQYDSAIDVVDPLGTSGRLRECHNLARVDGESEARHPWHLQPKATVQGARV